MTNIEALKYFKDANRTYDMVCVLPKSDIGKCVINALEKQIAKKPIFTEDKQFALCPCCDMNGLTDKQNYCDSCGQKLNWGNDEE